MKNMKKILLSILSLVFIVVFSSSVYWWDAPCSDFEGDRSITDLVTGCIESNGQLTVGGNDVTIGTGTNNIINTLIGNLWIMLSIWAVIMIVYAGLLMTMSGWNDEKIKKWKDLLKWTLIGYIALLTAGWIVSFVISLIFNIAAGS